MGLTEIQRAIEALPPEQQRELASWIAERDRCAWDADIERDFSPGGAGEALLKDVRRQIRDGKSRPLSDGPGRA